MATYTVHLPNTIRLSVQAPECLAHANQSARAELAKVYSFALVHVVLDNDDSSAGGVCIETTMAGTHGGSRYSYPL